jgi:hypothetical protein
MLFFQFVNGSIIDRRLSTVLFSKRLQYMEGTS